MISNTAICALLPQIHQRNTPSKTMTAFFFLNTYKRVDYMHTMQIGSLRQLMGDDGCYVLISMSTGMRAIYAAHTAILP